MISVHYLRLFCRMQQSIEIKRNIIAENNSWLRVKYSPFLNLPPFTYPTHISKKYAISPTCIHIRYSRPHQYAPLHTHIPHPTHITHPPSILTILISIHIIVRRRGLNTSLKKILHWFGIINSPSSKSNLSCESFRNPKMA